MSTMKRSRSFGVIRHAALAAFTALAVRSTDAAAAAPHRLPQSGRLLDSQGSPEVGTVSIEFTLYDAAVGGNILWQETQSLTLDDGYFSAQLGDVTAIPANVPHALTLDGPYAGVAYLDARHYRFEDVRRLARLWAGFVPGVDSIQEAFGDAQKVPRRRLDARLSRALDILDTDDDETVRECAARVGLSESRLTHLMVDELGAPPRTWRRWLKLRRAIGATVLRGTNLTQAAHDAGFTDSAHLTRTCKQLTGVLPSQMLPRPDPGTKKPRRA